MKRYVSEKGLEKAELKTEKMLAANLPGDGKGDSD